MSKGIFYAGILALIFTQVHMQAAALPETYSFSANSNMGGPMTVKVNRNGAKELIEMRLQSGGMHLRQLYDFQAHRVYNLDLNVNRCTTQEYTSPYAPAMHDPIGGSAEMAGQVGSLPVLGSENVNGIATKVVEAALPKGQGKYKFWLEQKFNFPVKQALTLGSQPERVLFEILELSFAPSPASLFAMPSGCGPVSGVTSATGGHAEANVEVKASGTHQLGQAGAPQAGVAKVTAVRLRLVPESYAGPCPSRVQLVGDITTNGAGIVWYEFLAGAVRKSGPGGGKITFNGAGTQTVTLEAEYVSTPRVPTSLLAVMEDEQGRRPPQNVSSGPVKYNATCTAQAPAGRR